MNVAWLAGFFDGEGSVGLYSQGTKTGYKSLKLSICQKNEAVIREIHAAYPEGHVRCYKPKDAWYFAISGARPAERILRDMLPYLKIKRQKAEEALVFIELVKKGRTRDSSGRFVEEQRSLAS